MILQSIFTKQLTNLNHQLRSNFLTEVGSIKSFKKVLNVLMFGKNNTVKEQPEKIDSNIQLNTKARIFSPFQFKFERIPPQNLDQFWLRPKVTSQRYSSQRITISVYTSSVKFKPSLGLATQKFFSSKAEKSITFNRINYKQKIKIDIQNVRKERDCPRNHPKKIFFKHSAQDLRKFLEKESKTIDNLKESTHEYLKNMRTEEDDQTLLY